MPLTEPLPIESVPTLMLVPPLAILAGQSQQAGAGFDKNVAAVGQNGIADRQIVARLIGADDEIGAAGRLQAAAAADR